MKCAERPVCRQKIDQWLPEEGKEEEWSVTISVGMGFLLEVMMLKMF
jgi:hypothetical protein